MTELETPVYESIRNCRYCLSDENENDLVSPCKCKGSAKYVHTKCLLEWFDKRNQKIIIPGAFYQFNQSCEICHTKYQFEYTNIEPKYKLWVDISLYIFCVTTLLGCFYLGTGYALQETGYSDLFTQQGTHWENIFYNGFVMVHIIIAIFYIIMLFITSRPGNGCVFLYCPDINCRGGDDCLVIILCLVIIGIIGTVLIIYYDIITRLVQRYNNNCLLISSIKPYEEEENV